MRGGLLELERTQCRGESGVGEIVRAIFGVECFHGVGHVWQIEEEAGREDRRRQIEEGKLTKKCKREVAGERFS